MINGYSQDIGQPQADVQVINTELARQTHFRGYFTTNDEILSLANPAIGDYAYSAEDLLVWDYDGSQWIETDKIVPDQMTPASDANPQADGTVTAGTSTEYSRRDHIHPLNISTNTPISDSASGSVGTSVNYARSDHSHPINISSTTPLQDNNGSVGTANSYARSDHQHPINVETNASNILQVDGVGINGTSAFYARQDHIHPQQLTYDGNVTATKFIKTGGTANDVLLADGSTKQNSIASKTFTVIDPEQYVKLCTILAVNSTTDNSIKFEVTTRTGFGQLQSNQHWTNGYGISEYQYLFIPTLATGISKAWILYFNDGVDRYGELWCKIDFYSYNTYIYATEVSVFQGNITNILTTDGQTQLPEGFSTIQQLFPNQFNTALQVNPIINGTFNYVIRIARNPANLWSNIQFGCDPNSNVGFIDWQWLIGSTGNNGANPLGFIIVKAGQEGQSSGLQINQYGNVLNFYGQFTSGNIQINPTATGYDDGLRISRADPTSTGNSSIYLGCSRTSTTGSIDVQWSTFTPPSSSINNLQSFVIAKSSQAGDNNRGLQISADGNTLTFNGRQL
ncbi:MAG: hypothetical protein EZS28_009871 [Streblomastix strix]|uniref:Uncharacterized protein n=1 Tax=Streblomastix strix TaxID=222440 RepID=A0A5J4WIE1_9EUKA|nr:MAG: hypothetical protein EZS28_009871 [Streblomastix strix]